MIRYALIVAAYYARGPVKRDVMMAQVLSSALEGVVHNAARRGLLAAPKLKRELVARARRYLEGIARYDGELPLANRSEKRVVPRNSE
ncbi:hypothetical protein [Burkholderia stabilis]|uniref:Uncharacterized protein n=1 Tax=Burkholderia stabilis TaxID=95485 RepID=A0AAJ5NIV1_9BURK|nr:hypothetical protein [Burkholderia stabilis]VBB16001.1 hypothetical protein BSTAB16_6200 [Burkholderia stabilis]